MTLQEISIRDRVATYETDAAKHNWTRSRCQDDRVALIAALDVARAANNDLEARLRGAIAGQNFVGKDRIATLERENAALREALSAVCRGAGIIAEASLAGSMLESDKMMLQTAVDQVNSARALLEGKRA